MYSYRETKETPSCHQAIGLNLLYFSSPTSKFDEMNVERYKSSGTRRSDHRIRCLLHIYFHITGGVGISHRGGE
ncbi:hypothetical protein AQUCO_00700766v1 [Aquilegia coerulea]|uniref:Uncharacterized protein n=1 Tax=Aquilegia coerulea TaxID=218851 RepID=A0A2G5ELM6_AQUCA|nr:hypothetical protein AQUCO_00700766v1 [Aquilegia coerulea]